jgi:hypothetical protein
MSAPAISVPSLSSSPAREKQDSEVVVEYHPSFNDADADVVLQSQDGVHFRIHSFTLRVGSGMFRDLLSLPQPNPSTPKLSTAAPQHDLQRVMCDPSPSSPSVISANETADIVLLLLCLLSCIPLPEPLSSLPNKTTDRILALAEAWDASGPISFIRASLFTWEHLKRDPIRAYAIASHFGWTEERKLASFHTLCIPEPELLSYFSTNSSDAWVPTAADILALLALRRARRDGFRAQLDSRERFSAGNTEDFLCTYCGVTLINNASWRALKHAMVLEMDRAPLGDGIVGRPVHGLARPPPSRREPLAPGRGKAEDDGTLGVIEWSEGDRCWKARCAKSECNGLNYDRVTTLKQIRRIVDALPMYVGTQEMLKL